MRLKMQFRLNQRVKTVFPTVECIGVITDIINNRYRISSSQHDYTANELIAIDNFTIGDFVILRPTIGTTNEVQRVTAVASNNKVRLSDGQLYDDNAIELFDNYLDYDIKMPFAVNTPVLVSNDRAIWQYGRFAGVSTTGKFMIVDDNQQKQPRFLWDYCMVAGDIVANKQ
jgi:hypothetical protein